ncbi:hypothetical protein ACSFB7_37125 [Variovorax sp. GB1P17]
MEKIERELMASICFAPPNLGRESLSLLKLCSQINKTPRLFDGCHPGLPSIAATSASNRTVELHKSF